MNTQEILLDAYGTDDFSNFSNPTTEEEDVYSDLFGIGKNAKAKRGLKLEKRSLKNDIIKAKAEGIRTGTYKPGEGFANVLSGVVGAAKSILGGGSPEAEQPTEQDMAASGKMANPNTVSKKNTLIWVGLAILILAALYVFVIKPKMKK
jgi:hypothetical protein